MASFLRYVYLPAARVLLPTSVFQSGGADSYLACCDLKRILVTLLTKGRSHVGQIAQHTTLSPRQIRNGLGVLIQQNLLYHHTDPDSGITSYEANPDACYSLVRSGKILEVINSQYGAAERDLVQTLMLLGYARIADLTHAFESRTRKVNGHTNGHTESSELIESHDDLHVTLARLIQAEIIETVRPDSFRNPADILLDIELEVTRTGPGEKANKHKPELHEQIVDRFCRFREQTKLLKRQIDQSGGLAPKRRKLQNGGKQNGHSHFDDMPDLNVRLRSTSRASCRLTFASPTLWSGLIPRNASCSYVIVASQILQPKLSERPLATYIIYCWNL